MEEVERAGVPVVFAESETEWRNWLQANHDEKKSAWLVIFKKESGFPSVYYPEAVDQALCFGWIDSKPNKRDENSYYQFFAKRNPKSKWSRVNKEKVTRLQAQNLLHESGLKMIALAKKSGTWDALNDVENLQLPADLADSFASNDVAFKNWDAFPKSVKRGILEWIAAAKTAPTREKRIQQTVAAASINKRILYDK